MVPSFLISSFLKPHDPFMPSKRFADMYRAEDMKLPHSWGKADLGRLPKEVVESIRYNSPTPEVRDEARAKQHTLGWNRWGLPPVGAGRLKWLLMFLASVLAVAILQRGRLRYSILGCVILLMLWGTIGCGNNASQSTPRGYYPLTIQAVSGSTTQIIKVSLHVQ